MPSPIDLLLIAVYIAVAWAILIGLNVAMMVAVTAARKIANVSHRSNRRA